MYGNNYLQPDFFKKIAVVRQGRTLNIMWSKPDKTLFLERKHSLILTNNLIVNIALTNSGKYHGKKVINKLSKSLLMYRRSSAKSRFISSNFFYQIQRLFLAVGGRTHTAQGGHTQATSVLALANVPLVPVTPAAPQSLSEPGKAAPAQPREPTDRPRAEAGGPQQTV